MVDLPMNKSNFRFSVCFPEGNGSIASSTRQGLGRCQVLILRALRLLRVIRALRMSLGSSAKICCRESCKVNKKMLCIQYIYILFILYIYISYYIYILFILYIYISYHIYIYICVYAYVSIYIYICMYNANTGLITPPTRSRRSTRSVGY